MKLGVIARRTAGQPLGVARLIQYLVRYWDTMLEPPDEGVLFMRDRPTAELETRNLSARVLPSRFDGLLWENLVLPPQAKDVDVLFSPSYTIPLKFSGRTVVGIQSMNEAWSGTHPWWYRYRYSQIYRLSAQKADAVIAPSLSTAEDLIRVYKIPRERVSVVMQGADDSFRPLDNPERALESRRRLLGSDDPYVVFVGKLSQRRNIPVLIEAFGQLKRQDHIPHKLLLFGPNHLNLPLDRLAREAGIEDSFLQTDGLVASHEELIDVYNAADLFVSASSYEGYSLPMVEALACGVPIVAVNRSAQAEIAADAALLVGDATPELLAEAMHRVLTDDSLRKTLRERGLVRARQLRWEETARKTLEILRSVAEGPQR